MSYKHSFSPAQRNMLAKLLLAYDNPFISPRTWLRYQACNGLHLQTLNSLRNKGALEFQKKSYTLGETVHLRLLPPHVPPCYTEYHLVLDNIDHSLLKQVFQDVELYYEELEARDREELGIKSSDNPSETERQRVKVKALKGQVV